jgi:long-chain-fatty-acyl-CoA reductase
VGTLWLEYKLKGRRMASRYAPLVTEFSDIVIEGDFKTMGDFMIQRFHTYDQVESEFGTDRIFDEWIPHQMSYIRAFPRGLCLHYLVGNLPIAAIYSILRGIITKNITVAKVASRDPVSAIGFILSVIEVDPQHPISRSLSAGYWEKDAEVGDEALAISDTVCAWGGYNAIAQIKKKIPPNVNFVEFGPKWSVSAIDLERCDMEKAAFRVIEDSSYYDQEACFNTQRVYVRGEVDKFVECLVKHYKEFSVNVPYLSTSIDIAANRSLALSETQYIGCKVIQGNDWAIIVADAREKTNITHPFNRTLIIHPIDSFNEISQYFDNYNQTMSVYPWDMIKEYRDEWAGAGICRFVELGWSRIFRSGFTHDGMHAMHSMVRLVCIERPWTDMGKYYSLRPSLEAHWFKEKYPAMRQIIDERNEKEDRGEI